jgi:hypothetical protein
VQPQLKDSYSEMGRPSIDPELLLRMLLIEYLYGITSERKLVEELRMHLAWRWFTGPGFDQEIPHHSTKLISSSILRYTLTCTGTNSGTHLEFSMDLMASSAANLPIISASLRLVVIRTGIRSVRCTNAGARLPRFTFTTNLMFFITSPVREGREVDGSQSKGAPRPSLGCYQFCLCSVNLRLSSSISSSRDQMSL